MMGNRGEMCLFSMKILGIFALNNYAVLLRDICLIMIVIFVMADDLESLCVSSPSGSVSLMCV